MKLQMDIPPRYRVKRGQRLLDIARAFSVPPRVLAVCNGLTEEPEEGRILEIPPSAGDLYTVRGGETRELLCGSKENFRAKNRTDLLYPGQPIWL